MFSIDASDPLDVAVCDEEDAEAWAEGEVDEANDDNDERPLFGYLYLTGLTECRERRFTVPEDARYALLLDDEAAEVAIHAAIWAAEE